MDDRETQIDLLFRNGLKDYEVLPPADVWDNIVPVIRRRQRPYMILRVAATITVLVTLGLLTYTWNNEASQRMMTSSVWQDLVPEEQVAYSPEPIFLADARSEQQQKIITQGFQTPEDEAITVESSNLRPIGSNTEIHTLLTGSLSESELAPRNPARLISLNRPVSAKLDFEEYQAPLVSSDNLTEATKRWTVAALVSPTYMSSFGSVSGEFASQVKSSEQPVISYAGGIALSYKVSRRLSVQSGLYYSSYENQLSGISTFSGFTPYDQAKGNVNFTIQTSNGMVAVNNPDVYLIDNLTNSRMQSFYDKSSFDLVKSNLQYIGNSLQQNMSYIELPLFVRYKLIDRVFDFNIVGGLSSNLLVNNSVYASLDGDKLQIAETEDLRSLTFSSSIGMGVEYNLGKGVSFNLEPTFRYYLNPYTGTGNINIHPYSIGVFSGLSYKF